MSLVIAYIRHIIVFAVAHIAALATLLVLDCTQVRKGNLLRTFCRHRFLRLLLFEDWSHFFKRIGLVILTHACQLVYKTLNHMDIPKQIKIEKHLLLRLGL